MRDRIRTNIKISVIGLITLAIFSYAYFETIEVLRGPIIEIKSPESGYTATNKVVEISGNVKNVSYMYLNGKPIFADTSGKFKEKVILNDGYNSVFIEAKDRIGNKKSEILELIVNNNKASIGDGLARDEDALKSI